jgi:hypothetical protein
VKYLVIAIVACTVVMSFLQSCNVAAQNMQAAYEVQQ